MTDAPLRIWLQEPVGLEHERTWCAEPMSDDDDEYHLHTREALAQSPIVQAMIEEAVERMDAADADLLRRADIMAGMLRMGERIAFGTDADMIAELAAAIRRRG